METVIIGNVDLSMTRYLLEQKYFEIEDLMMNQLYEANAFLFSQPTFDADDPQIADLLDAQSYLVYTKDNMKMALKILDKFHGEERDRQSRSYRKEKIEIPEFKTEDDAKEDKK